MSSTKKGNNYHFGMKAHSGVDAESGRVHTVEVTTAKVADGAMAEALLHGEEKVVGGARAYTRKNRNLTAGQQDEPAWAFPFKRQKDRRSKPFTTACRLRAVP